MLANPFEDKTVILKPQKKEGGSTASSLVGEEVT